LIQADLSQTSNTDAPFASVFFLWVTRADVMDDDPQSANFQAVHCGDLYQDGNRFFASAIAFLIK
jgi:hypothetical protein